MTNWMSTRMTQACPTTEKEHQVQMSQCKRHAIPMLATPGGHNHCITHLKGTHSMHDVQSSTLLHLSSLLLQLLLSASNFCFVQFLCVWCQCHDFLD